MKPSKKEITWVVSVAIIFIISLILGFIDLKWFSNVVGIILFLSFFALFFTFFRFTVVKEGTAAAIMRLGSFRKFVMVWEGFSFIDGWDVKEKPKRRKFFGGLRFAGFWPLDSVFHYNFRWRDIQLVGGEEKEQFHEVPNMSYIFVRPDVYLTELNKAETVPPERLPLTIKFLVTMRIINPYKALFLGPSNWNENAMIKLNSMFRDWVGLNTFDTILSVKEVGTLMGEFKTSELIKNLAEKWGIQVEDIQIRTLSLPKEYEEAAAKEREMELGSKGVAKETVGLVIQMMAEVRGKKPEEVRAEIDKDEKKLAEFLILAQDLVTRKMVMSGGAYKELHITGVAGGSGLNMAEVMAAESLAGRGTKSPVSDESADTQKPSASVENQAPSSPPSPESPEDVAWAQRKKDLSDGKITSRDLTQEELDHLEKEQSK